MSHAVPMATAGDALRAYIRGWLAGDAAAVVAAVADDAVVIESHGPTYWGATEIRGWVERWVAAGDRVHRWEIVSMVESDDGLAAAAEWDFACTAAGVDYEILGASVVTAAHGRLTRITEYRREPEVA